MGTTVDVHSGRWRSDSLVRVAADNPCPVLRISRDGILLAANAGSWLVLQEWGVAVGSRVPDPWLSVITTTADSGETREAILSAGLVGIVLLFVPARDHDCVHVFGADVTSRKQIEHRVSLNAQVFESASEGILIMDSDMRVIDANPAYTQITDYPPEETLGETAPFCRADGQDPHVLAQLWDGLRTRGAWQGECWGHRRNGERYAQWLSIAEVKGRDGLVHQYIGLLSDITRQKQAEDQLFRMAHYDMLTELPNRRLFQDRLAQMQSASERTDEQIWVMLVDLDGFKLVNDYLGHRAGDETLRIVAQRISGSVRKSDTVARMGGDEFLILLRHVVGFDDAAAIADAILRRVAEPVILEDQEFFLTASIGISRCDSAVDGMEDLLRNLDSAMYSVKNEGKNGYRFVSDESQNRIGARLARQTELRRALDREEVHVHYQGQVDVARGKIAGLEALARWNAPDGVAVPPGEFIPLAEEAGLINQLGEHILRTACLQGAAWRAQGIHTGPIGVNVSVRQLHHNGFVPLVERVLRETGFPPTLLNLELSETMWIEGEEEIISKLGRLRTMGITVSIDDFGTKYASLSYLKKFPVDQIKIDKSFVDDLPSDHTTSAIVAAIMTMADTMGVEVTAEGVERREQLEFLVDHGCRLIQGNYFLRPAEPDTIPGLLKYSNFTPLAKETRPLATNERVQHGR